MHFISQLGIRGRLVAGFAAVCGIIAAAVGYTVFAVGGISTTVDRMVNLRTPVALESTEMVGQSLFYAGDLARLPVDGQPARQG